MNGIIQHLDLPELLLVFTHFVANFLSNRKVKLEMLNRGIIYVEIALADGGGISGI